MMWLRVLSLFRSLLLVIAVLACAPSHAASADIEALVAEGHLQIDTKLTPTGMVVPGQKLTLTLKIATERWFSGGTRIKLPEVPGLVILQTEQFASNASERRGNQSWVIQRWTLDVYPQRAGDFTIPPISAQVNVNSNDGDVEGSLASPPVNVTVSLPVSLAEVAQWVAAPDFTVEQRFDRATEKLKVGDAFEREVVFKASDVMAMMLPAFAAEELTGLAAYPSPPVLDNSSNRGQTLATRSQRISYVAQADGEYLLPARDFFWWNTERSELQVLTLPPTAIIVGAGAASEGDKNSTTLRITPRQLLLAAGGVVLLIFVLWLARKLLVRLPLAPVAAAIATWWKTLLDLRKPALPERLNPDSSAGE
jgi:hypothetical protein